ncbi:MAG: hypothetical protein JKY93_02330 [Gammaproteobacteria bacterium]|nr:hypothetical protein [Gammaproteobacteria bacterium]
MKKAIIYHLISLFWITISLWLFNPGFGAQEVKTIALYAMFMIGTYLYVNPWLPKKRLVYRNCPSKEKQGAIPDV